MQDPLSPAGDSMTIRVLSNFIRSNENHGRAGSKARRRLTSADRVLDGNSQALLCVLPVRVFCCQQRMDIHLYKHALSHSTKTA